MTPSDSLGDHPNRTAPHVSDPPAGTGASALAPSTRGEDHAADGPPTAADEPGRPDQVGRYRVLGELARGGMGVVYRAEDAALGRDVAVKVLQPHLRCSPLAGRRFIEEARITGQLQHPGVPPVFEVGDLPDGSPFLAMKLIKGRTLAALLAAEAAPDRGPLVAVCEQVCQAVAYAHEHGVIHRDLKPANVMVGRFGEVQVMDWGLAKVLAAAAPPAAATLPPVGTTMFADPRAGSDEAATEAGAILGTPAFMPPEQAAGAVELIDRRSDVFGLGSILCVVLTGQPPFVGATSEAIRLLAAQGKLDEAFARLDACGADPGLVELCQRCLAADRAARPADAGEVAKAVAALRAKTEERARRAELDRVRAESERTAAEGKAAAERQRRRAQLALAASLLALVGVAGAGAWYGQKQAADRDRAESERLRQAAAAEQEQAVQRERVRVGVEADLAQLPEFYRRALWGQAEAALAQAEKLLGPDGDPELRARVAAARADTAFIKRLDDIRLDKATFVDNSFDFASAASKYAAAFREHGLDVLAGDPAAVADRLNASAVREYLSAALDDWGLTDRDRDHRRRIFAATAATTGQAWRTRLSDVWADADRLAAVYDAIPERERSPALVYAVGIRLKSLSGDGNRRLEDGLRQYPSDFWLHFGRGFSPEGTDEKADVRRDPAGVAARVGAYRAALALRPGTPAAYTSLGNTLRHSGDLAGAIAACREAIRLDPKLAQAHNNLGNALRHSGDLAGAIAAHREAIRLDPTYAQAHNNLGVALRDGGDLAGAIAAYREAIRLDPKYDLARRNLLVTERWVELDRQLPAVKNRETLPRTPAEAVELGRFAVQPFKQEYALAYRLYADALAADPKLAGPINSHRYNAACFALRFAAGDDRAVKPAAEEAARARRLARGWFADELAALRTMAASDKAADRKKAADALAHWQQDTDLASVRDPQRRAALPADERHAWEKLWADVAALRQQPGEKPPAKANP
jgi:tetratricopeptide (TPR) repeat protein